jgi:hypothetical protein
MAPMFFYEVGLGIWLLVKGMRAPAAAGGPNPAPTEMS